MARVIIATAHHDILRHLAQALTSQGHTVVAVLSAGALPIMAEVVASLGCPHVALPLVPGQLHIGRAMQADPAYAEQVHASVAGLRDLDADFMVGWAIHILPPFLLELARHPINVHPSDLPRYRGGFPFEAQILDGARRFCLSVHHTVRRIDAGQVLARSQPLKIRRSDTMTALLNRSLPVGSLLAAHVVTHWDQLPPVPAPPLESPLPHAWGIKRVRDADGRLRNHGVIGRLRIEWHLDSSVDIHRAARAFDMIGGALTNRGPDLFRITAAKLLEPAGAREPGEVLAVGEGTFDVQATDGVVRLQGHFVDPACRIEPGERFVSTEPISKLLVFPDAER